MRFLTELIELLMQFSTKPKWWRAVRASPSALKLNAFLSDFSARPPQNAVINVQVPFLFKLAIDWLATSTSNPAALAEFSASNSTALAVFATPVAVLVGYGIARLRAAAFNVRL